MGAQRGADRFGANARQRAVVAEQEAAAADHGFAVADASDRRRASAGDHQRAVAAAMGAEAAGDGVIGGAHAGEIGITRLDARCVVTAGETGEPNAERQSAAAAGPRPALAQTASICPSTAASAASKST